VLQRFRQVAREGSSLLEVAFQFAATVFGRVCYLLLQVLLARRLGPDGFGFYAIGWTVVGLAGTLAPIGMPQATQRFNIGGGRALCAAPMAVVLVAGGAAALGLLLGANFLAVHVFSNPGAAGIIEAFAPAVPLYSMLMLLWSALRVSHAILLAAGLGALLFPLNLAAILLGFHLNASPVMAAHMYVASLVLVVLPSAVLLRARRPMLCSPPLRELLYFGVVSMVIGGANILNLWADRVVIGIMADIRTVGLYQVASQLAMVAIVFRAAVVTIFEARVPKIAKPGAKVPDVTREFVAGLRVLVHTSAPGLMGLTLTAGFWVTTLFGPDYAAAALPFAVLAVGQVLVTFLGPASNALHMTGEERATMCLTIAGCVGNVLGNAALLPVLGLPGAAAATVAANVLVSAISFRRLRATGRLHLPRGAIGDMGMAILVATFAGYVLKLALGGDTLAAGLAVPVLVCAVYGVIVVGTCTVDDEAVALARGLVRRICIAAMARPRASFTEPRS
jgi:O-antigen/teichoic acid export membrane protein